MQEIKSSSLGIELTVAEWVALLEGRKNDFVKNKIMRKLESHVENKFRDIKERFYLELFSNFDDEDTKDIPLPDIEIGELKEDYMLDSDLEPVG